MRHEKFRENLEELEQALEDHFNYEGFYDPTEKLEEFKKLISRIEWQVTNIDPTYIPRDFLLTKKA